MHENERVQPWQHRQVQLMFLHPLQIEETLFSYFFLISQELRNARSVMRVSTDSTPKRHEPLPVESSTSLTLEINWGSCYRKKSNTQTPFPCSKNQFDTRMVINGTVNSAKHISQEPRVGFLAGLTINLHFFCNIPYIAHFNSLSVVTNGDNFWFHRRSPR